MDPKAVSEKPDSLPPTGQGKVRKKHWRIVRRLSLLFLIIIIGWGLIAWWLPVPALSATYNPVQVAIKPSPLIWPSYGESAIGAIGYGILASTDNQAASPTASVAKIITALTVLEAHPLSLGQQGPIITLGPADVASYQHYSSIGGSTVLVSSGEQLSEYQAIEAMLLPSANNMADSLATWAYGSIPSYIQTANQLLSRLGLAQTVVTDDASGYLPNTKSTARDLVKLGIDALNNPVLAQVVNQKQVSLPVAGEIKNVNWLLGTDGIIGIKTGNTDQAGGVFLFAADHNIAPNYSVTIVGAIMGAPTLQKAMDDSVPLLNSSAKNFVLDKVISSGEVVGRYTSPWDHSSVEAAASQDITLPIWSGAVPSPLISLGTVNAPKLSGSDVGTVSINFNGKIYSSPITISKTISQPPWYWRLKPRPI